MTKQNSSEQCRMLLDVMAPGLSGMLNDESIRMVTKALVSEKAARIEAEKRALKWGDHAKQSQDVARKIKKTAESYENELRRLREVVTEPDMESIDRILS